MLDENGYRYNVGIVIINDKQQVFWAKRTGKAAWQFPQGGIKRGELIEQAMYRELKEETGIENSDVKILGRTKNWLYYDVPRNLIKKENRNFYKGQRQIWYLVRFDGQDKNIFFPYSQSSEFDAWKWVDFSAPPNMVIDFKKDVYSSALLELAPIIFKSSKLEEVKTRLSL